MSKKVIRAKLDIIFKKLFSENLDLLHELLAGLLQLPKDSIQNIVIKNSEILPDSIAGKFVRMDLNMEVDSKLINVEMQYGSDSNYKDRTLFYWAKLYGGELQSGDDYDKLKQSICINIVNYPIFDCEDFHSHFTVMERTRHEELTDKCAIHFFELAKISKRANKDNMTELWLQLINAETEEELEMLAQTGVESIQKAVYVIYEMSEDEKVQEMARIREKALHDEASQMKTAEQQGEMKKAVAIAKNLLGMGMPIEQIEKATGLTSKEIELLRT